MNPLAKYGIGDAALKVINRLAGDGPAYDSLRSRGPKPMSEHLSDISIPKERLSEEQLSESELTELVGRKVRRKKVKPAEKNRDKINRRRHPEWKKAAKINAGTSSFKKKRSKRRKAALKAVGGAAGMDKAHKAGFKVFVAKRESEEVSALDQIREMAAVETEAAEVSEDRAVTLREAAYKAIVLSCDVASVLEALVEQLDECSDEIEAVAEGDCDDETESKLEGLIAQVAEVFGKINIQTVAEGDDQVAESSASPDAVAKKASEAAASAIKGDMEKINDKWTDGGWDVKVKKSVRDSVGKLVDMFMKSKSDSSSSSSIHNRVAEGEAE